jgi:hypothetical protein
MKLLSIIVRIKLKHFADKLRAKICVTALSNALVYKIR